MNKKKLNNISTKSRILIEDAEKAVKESEEADKKLFKLFYLNL